MKDQAPGSRPSGQHVQRTGQCHADQRRYFNHHNDHCPPVHSNHSGKPSNRSLLPHSGHRMNRRNSGTFRHPNPFGKVSPTEAPALATRAPSGTPRARLLPATAATACAAFSLAHQVNHRYRDRKRPGCAHGLGRRGRFPARRRGIDACCAPAAIPPAARRPPLIRTPCSPIAETEMWCS